MMSLRRTINPKSHAVKLKVVSLTIIYQWSAQSHPLGRLCARTRDSVDSESELEGKVDQDIPGESMRSENSDELGDDDMMLCKVMKAEAFGCCSDLESQVTANENPE